MKKMILLLAVMLTLAACAEVWAMAQNPPDAGSTILAAAEPVQQEEPDAQPISSSTAFDAAKGNSKAVLKPAVTDEDKADTDMAVTTAAQDPSAEGLPKGQEADAAEEQPASPAPFAESESTAVSEMIPQPESQPTEAPAPAAYGAIPFELAAGTGTWWKVDATDSAYWAVQENINAMRAAGGLPALSMDASLSSIASARCESFVAGGPFDHSGMVTRSEICAAGPLCSASAVCSAWQASEVHYANIMRSDISSMGVGCWFCEMNGNRYTYWTVTFE